MATIRGNGGDNTLRGGDGRDFIFGNGGDDFIYGGEGSDQLHGGNGNDHIYGGGGNPGTIDYLYGGNGNDTLEGGGGGDSMTGGNGADIFRITSVFEGSPKGASIDSIEDFSHEQGDRIGVKEIDANLTRAGDQAFQVIGTRAFSAPGQIRYEQVYFDSDIPGVAGWLTFVDFNTDNDSAAEMSIVLDGYHALQGSDFFL